MDSLMITLILLEKKEKYQKKKTKFDIKILLMLVRQYYHMLTHKLNQ